MVRFIVGAGIKDGTKRIEMLDWFDKTAIIIAITAVIMFVLLISSRL